MFRYRFRITAGFRLIQGWDREDECGDGHGLEDVHDTILEGLMDDMEIQRDGKHQAGELRLHYDAIAPCQRDERGCNQLPDHDAQLPLIRVSQDAA